MAPGPLSTFVKLAYSYFENPFAILLIFALVPLTAWLLSRDWVKVKEDPEVVQKKKHTRKIMLLTRSLIILLLLTAIAKPYVQHEKVIPGDPIIKILVDNSTSMAVFENIAPELAEKLEKKLEVRTKTIAAGERSDLGDAILGQLEPHGSLLLLTDGNSNAGSNIGDVALFASKMNASINVIKLEPKESDVGVAVLGPAKTMQGVENKYTVLINRAGQKQPASLKVTIDGETVIDETTTEPVKTFTRKLTEGYHQIVAQVTAPNDYFSENNIFYKTVKAVPKPRIAYVSEKDSPMATLLKELYKVDVLDRVPARLDDYYAIAINDVPASKLNPHVDKLTEFVTDGNGMVVVGGNNAFEHGEYKDSVFESMLPVFVSAPGKKPGEVSVVMVIDISGSTSAAFGDAKTVDVEKALAIDAFKQLRPDTRLAVVAFNTQAYLISEPSYVYEKTNLDERIARLRDGGGTLVNAGLLKAVDVLSRMSGSKNIILISDGKTQSETAAIESAKFAANNGIKIYTVGVGPTTNENVMIQIAEITNGIYFRAQEESRLKLLFGDVEEREPETGRMGLVVLNSNHFITKDFEPTAALFGFNNAVPKTTARLLATTSTGEPVLTIWRFGLGRIAAWTTDDGSEWAGQTLNQQNSPLIARTFNWAIGDPDRKAESFVDAKDTAINEPTEVTVKSSTVPKAEGTTFYKVGEDTYTASITPEQLGFQQVAGAMFAANYPSEYLAVGFNPELSKIARSTGGKVFDKNDIEGIVEHTKSTSRRIINTKENLGWPFVLAATIVFLIEIFIRRLIRRE